MSRHPGAFRIRAEQEERPEPRSNAELQAEWLENSMAGSAHNTVQYARTSTSAYLRALAELPVVEAGPGALRQYMDAYMAVCSSFSWGEGRSDGCAKGMDLAGCGKACDGFQLKKRDSFMAHMRPIVAWHEWLVFRGHAEKDFARATVKQYAAMVHWSRERQEIGFRPKMEDVRAFITGEGRPHRRAVYAAMAKLGLRIHEVGLIRDENVHFDGVEHLGATGSWVYIPQSPDRRHGKRKGNAWLPIDRELRRELEAYLDWKHGPRRPGSPPLDHGHFFVNHQRGALGRSNVARGKLAKTWFHDHAVRLGLRPKGRLDPDDRWRTHSMRYFFSDHIYEQGLRGLWYGVLRGDDVVGGTSALPRGEEMAGRYTDTKDMTRIQRVYQRYAPIVGWR